MNHGHPDTPQIGLTGRDERASIPFQRLKNSQSGVTDRPVDSGDETSSSQRWRRRRTLVNSGHQLRFATVLLVQMTAVMLAIGCFAFIESQRTMAIVLKYLADFPLRTHELHLSNQAFLFRVLVLIALAAAVQLLFGIYMSHKVAGPVLKMTQVLDRARRGDFSMRVTFRSGDQLEELAAAMNRMLDSLSAEQRRNRALVDGIAESLSSLRGPDVDTERACSQLREQLASLVGIDTNLPVTADR